jgi:hypothetical protein
MRQKTPKNKGIIIINTLVFAFIAVIITTSFVSWVSRLSYSIRHLTVREQAFQIAEAGIDYYRWHLAHDPNDFQDGTGGSGPYVHDFEDKDGNVIGQFSLDITPPPTGTTIVAVRSTGIVTDPVPAQRTIEARFAIASLAKYAAVADADIRFGEGTEVFGPIHSNGGIRFDGLAHNIVTSATDTYYDDDYDACIYYSWGVHTCINPDDPNPPTTLPQRPDVFEAGRAHSQPVIDFFGLTNDLSDLRDEARYEGGQYFGASNGLGYHIVLKTNDTFDLYQVNSLVSPPAYCYSSQADWGTWSIKTGGEQLLGNYPNPGNGILFAEDNVWVDGKINTARITIAVGRFLVPESQYKSITVNKDLLYTNYDGQDVMALIAQKNINIGMVSENDLRIDSALIAQNGRVGRFYYPGPYFWYQRCSPYHERDTITSYGMIGSHNRYGFAYTDGTGYEIRNLLYDSNLLYGPPPSFPLTSDQYSILSWEEL